MASSHHGEPSQPSPEQEALMRRFIDQVDGKAKREYTHGRIGGEDLGTLAIAVAADKAHGTVILRFGKPVEWIGLSPKDVAGLVKMLIEKAREVATEPFTVEL